MGAAALLHRFPRRPRRDAQHRRFALAACASLLVHLWLAGELPAGRAPGSSPPPLEVTLRPAAAMPVLEPMTVEGDAAGALPKPEAVAKPVPPERSPARERPVRNEDADRGHAADSVVPSRLADVAYYSARQLDEYPALLAPLAIRYPERALAQRRAGRVLVRVTIDAAGRVRDASVVEAEPAGHFEDAAREALIAAAFSPGRRNGLPVGSRVLIQLRFDAETAGAAAP